jgi:hypothetical protein
MTISRPRCVNRLRAAPHVAADLALRCCHCSRLRQRTVRRRTRLAIRSCATPCMARRYCAYARRSRLPASLTSLRAPFPTSARIVCLTPRQTRTARSYRRPKRGSGPSLSVVDPPCALMRRLARAARSPSSRWRPSLVSSPLIAPVRVSDGSCGCGRRVLVTDALLC